MSATHKMAVALDEPMLDTSAHEVRTVVPVPLARWTIVIRLPLFYNPNSIRLRMPVGFGKFRETFRELKDHFSGFNVSLCFGWCTEDGMWDPHLRIDLDTEMTPDSECFLISWREVLRVRFEQRSMYMSKSGPVYWMEACNGRPLF